LRQLVAGRGNRHYSSELKARVMAYAERRYSEGASAKQVSDELGVNGTHSPMPLYGDFGAAGVTHDSDLRRRATFFGQLVRERDDLAVECRLDGGIQVDSRVQASEFG
jgi:hypothetical protein